MERLKATLFVVACFCVGGVLGYGIKYLLWNLGAG